MDVRDHTTTGNGSLNQGIQLLVTTNSELQVPGSDTLYFEILGGVSGQLQYFGGEVLEDSCAVNSSGGTNAAAGAHSGLQETVDTSDRELANIVSTSVAYILGVPGVLRVQIEKWASSCPYPT